MSLVGHIYENPGIYKIKVKNCLTTQPISPTCEITRTSNKLNQIIVKLKYPTAADHVFETQELTYDQSLTEPTQIIKDLVKLVTLNHVQILADELKKTVKSRTDTVTLSNLNDIQLLKRNNIQQIYFPDTVTEIPEALLSNAINLENVYFGSDTSTSKLTTIKESAFKDCISLKSLVFPDNLQVIEDDAFKGCTAISSIFFNNSTPYYNDSVFDSNLSSIYRSDQTLTEITNSVISSDSTFCSFSLDEHEHEHDYQTIGHHYAEINLFVDPIKLSTETVEVKLKHWSLGEITIDGLLSAMSGIGILSESIDTVVSKILDTVIPDDIKSKLSEEYKSNDTDPSFWSKLGSFFTDIISSLTVHIFGSISEVLKYIVDNVPKSSTFGIMRKYINGECTMCQTFGNLIGNTIMDTTYSDEDWENASVEARDNVINQFLKGLYDEQTSLTTKEVSEYLSSTTFKDMLNDLWDSLSKISILWDWAFDLFTDDVDKSTEESVNSISQNLGQITGFIAGIFQFIYLPSIYEYLRGSCIDQYMKTEVINSSAHWEREAYQHDIQKCQANDYCEADIKCIESSNQPDINSGDFKYSVQLNDSYNWYPGTGGLMDIGIGIIDSFYRNVKGQATAKDIESAKQKIQSYINGQISKLKAYYADLICDCPETDEEIKAYQNKVEKIRNDLNKRKSKK